MELEELIKKLETVELPQLKLPSHKDRLKHVLINKGYQKQPTKGVFLALKRIAIPPLVALALLALIILVETTLFPQYTSAKARSIALRNPQVKEWIAKGALIKDIQIQKNKAYLLISPSRANLAPSQSGERIFTGALVQVSFEKKDVEQINELLPTTSPLAPDQEEKAKKILEQSEHEINPKSKVTIQEIKPAPLLPEKLKIDKKTNEVEVIPEETEAPRIDAIYRVDGEKKTGTIDIQKQTIENVRVLEKDEKSNPEDHLKPQENE